MCKFILQWRTLYHCFCACTCTRHAKSFVIAAVEIGLNLWFDFIHSRYLHVKLLVDAGFSCSLKCFYRLAHYMCNFISQWRCSTASACVHAHVQFCIVAAVEIWLNLLEFVVGFHQLPFPTCKIACGCWIFMCNEMFVPFGGRCKAFYMCSFFL